LVIFIGKNQTKPKMITPSAKAMILDTHTLASFFSNILKLKITKPSLKKPKNNNKISVKKPKHHPKQSLFFKK
jgi:hypothetical protein